jgi:DNA-binding transcriptional LysR family regulator
MRQNVDKAANASGVSPAVLFETNNTSRMISLVAHGLGIAVLPESDAARTGGERRSCRSRRRTFVTRST